MSHSRKEDWNDFTAVKYPLSTVYVVEDAKCYFSLSLKFSLHNNFFNYMYNSQLLVTLNV